MVRANYFFRGCSTRNEAGDRELDCRSRLNGQAMVAYIQTSKPSKEAPPPMLLLTLCFCIAWQDQRIPHNHTHIPADIQTPSSFFDYMHAKVESGDGWKIGVGIVVLCTLVSGDGEELGSTAAVPSHNGSQVYL